MKKRVKYKVIFDLQPQWIFIILLMFLTWLPFTAQAQAICLDRNELVTRLMQHHLEKKKFFAFSNRQEVLEAYVNPTTETWTIIATTEKGCTYILGSGQGWYDTMPGDPVFWRKRWPVNKIMPNQISPKF